MQTAVELRQRVGTSVLNLTATENERQRHMDHGPVGPAVADASRYLADDINVGRAALKLKLANHAAKRHYRKNKMAYQEQAVIDAASEGIELNSWDQK